MIYFDLNASNHWFSELVDGKEPEGPPGSETVLKLVDIGVWFGYTLLSGDKQWIFHLFK